MAETETTPQGFLPDVIRKASLVEVKPEYFDGWSVAELTEWATSAARAYSAVTEHMRLTIGLWAWHLRTRLDDTDYTVAIQRFAQVLGVKSPTVGRWRTKAENHFALEAPDARTAAQRERLAREERERQEREERERVDALAHTQGGEETEPEGPSNPQLTSGKALSDAPTTPTTSEPPTVVIEEEPPSAPVLSWPGITKRLDQCFADAKQLSVAGTKRVELTDFCSAVGRLYGFSRRVEPR